MLPHDPQRLAEKPRLERRRHFAQRLFDLTSEQLDVMVGVAERSHRRGDLLNLVLLRLELRKKLVFSETTGFLQGAAET